MDGALIWDASSGDARGEDVLALARFELSNMTDKNSSGKANCFSMIFPEYMVMAREDYVFLFCLQ